MGESERKITGRESIVAAEAFLFIAAFPNLDLRLQWKFESIYIHSFHKVIIGQVNKVWSVLRPNFAPSLFPTKL